MAASGVESQRLISVSLGKIAQSRSQKGGINLHKNLLVATVLHKARTACMIEYQTLQRQRKLQFQQLQRQKESVTTSWEFEQKQEQARSAAMSLADFDTADEQNTIPTCVHEIVAEETLTPESSVSLPEVMTSTTAAAAATPVPDTHDSNLGQPTVEAATQSTSPCALVLSSTNGQDELGQNNSCDKENSPPCQTGSENDVTNISENNEQPFNHLAAATRLAEEAATPTGCPEDKHKFKTSASPTCNVLKRQREDNVEPHSTSHELPSATKKARLVATRRHTMDSHESSSHTDSSKLCSPPTDTSSHQISNLVSIFNSGFTGLCTGSPNSLVSNAEDYSSSLSCDSQSGQYTTLTPVHHSDFSSCKVSDSSSPFSSCSSSLGCLESLPALPAAIGLVLSV